MKKILILATTALLSVNIAAGNDPSIKGELRENIGRAMEYHIEKNQISGSYVLYDNIKDEVLSLSLKKLHSGIVSKGNFYVSCADFVDTDGNVFDIDFMVAGKKNNLRVYQALVHKADGKKRKYHLETASR